MIHCPKCGIVPVPEKDLPVLLPLDVKFTGTGQSPLDRWSRLSTCRARSAAARRGAKATPWTRSSIRPGISIATATRTTTRAPFAPKISHDWFPDRSIHRRRRTRDSASDLFALLDQDDARSGSDPELEPATRLFTQGMVLKDGAKMSKSLGNMVSPGRHGDAMARTPRVCIRCLPRLPIATWIGRRMACRGSIAFSPACTGSLLAMPDRPGDARRTERSGPAGAPKTASDHQQNYRRLR